MDTKSQTQSAARQMEEDIKLLDEIFTLEEKNLRERHEELREKILKGDVECRPSKNS